MVRPTLPLLLLIPLTAFAGDAGQIGYQQDLKIKAYSRLRQDDQIYFRQQEKIDGLKRYEDALERRQRILDQYAIERLDRDPDMVDRINGNKYGVLSNDVTSGSTFRTKKGYNEQTVDGRDGAQAARQLNVQIPENIIKEKLRQSQDCKGEQDDGNQKLLISKCFTSLSNTALLVTPYVSMDKTYTRGLSSTSSLIGKDGNHVCIVSVVKKGMWITARHCLANFNDNFKDLRIIVDNRMVEITGADSSLCTNKDKPCDIQYFYAETPKSAEIPAIYSKEVEVRWDNPVFIPGIPYGASLKEVFASESKYEDIPVTPQHAKDRYNDLVMWPPYNEGFCMSLAKDANGCIVHTCSTVRGFSGAPIYRYNKDTDKIELIGIHSGANPDLNRCATRNPKVNYARLITAEELPK
ncbi:hypothetical protein [Pseudomonas nicosulfuronedens]